MPNINLDEELYAVNWFDLKRPKLYDLYSQLVYPHVKAVGGKIHFKGVVTEKIKGPDENDRQMLLIVNYPNATQFLSMLNNRMFILKSVLRIKSVDYFTFGFTKRMGSGPQSLDFPVPYEGNSCYLLHHFQTKNSPSKSLYEMEEIMSDCQLTVHYMGFKAALVGRASDEQQLRTQPFLMDGISILQGKDKNQLLTLLEHKEFQKLSSRNLSNNIYHINRTI